MNNIPNLNDMLKLYTKKDLWERIQHHIKTIDTLRQQLEEKDKELKKWSTQYAVAYVNRQNALIAEKVELQQQLEEKEKEIERLNTIKNNAIECADLFKVALSVRQKDLALQELEKVKNLAVVLLEGFCHSIHYSQKEFRGHRYIEFYDLIRGIDNQITELKGEENGKD